MLIISKLEKMDIMRFGTKLFIFYPQCQENMSASDE